MIQKLQRHKSSVRWSVGCPYSTHIFNNHCQKYCHLVQRLKRKHRDQIFIIISQIHKVFLRVMEFPYRIGFLQSKTFLRRNRSQQCDLENIDFLKDVLKIENVADVSSIARNYCGKTIYITFNIQCQILVTHLERWQCTNSNLFRTIVNDTEIIARICNTIVFGWIQ